MRPYDQPETQTERKRDEPSTTSSIHLEYASRRKSGELAAFANSGSNRGLTVGSLSRCAYTVFMKRITLSIDDQVLSAARRVAAAQNSSVNALVREYLSQLAQAHGQAEAARLRLRQLSNLREGQLGERTWTREDLYER